MTRKAVDGRSNVGMETLMGMRWAGSMCLLLHLSLTFLSTFKKILLQCLAVV